MTTMSKKRLCLHDTDGVARNIWSTLLRDFRSSEDQADFCLDAERAFNQDLKSFRLGKVFPTLGLIRPERFKRYAQLENLLKKYRFANDVYTDKALNKLTLEKYFLEQLRLSSHRPMSMIGHRVLCEARKIARSILGKYSREDTVTLARFGKKSSIGCPLSLAYIDQKLTDVKAFTGSSQCARWFRKSVLNEDAVLNQLVKDMSINWTHPRLAHESLNLVNVPKTWKTYRTITPLTLLSLFYSYGVGEQVTARLKQSGLDLRFTQARHQKLVKGYSRSCTHATADLSAASDSLTSGLLNRVLPREWYCAVKKTFTHQVIYKDEEGLHSAYTESVLPMGNGCTFPVETLVFYCLIKAIGTLTEVDGVFSVFGDDLIYPSKLHKYVVRVFPDLGLVLNKDKTFVSYPFRESCGADYYRGCDVRSFYLKGERQLLTATQYSAFLYKTINGLLRRWDPLEIPSTIHYLFTEIANVCGEIYRVPPGYPDTAGIKTSDPLALPGGYWNLPWAPVTVLFQNGSRWFRFKFLSATSATRFVKSVLPYYWMALKQISDDPSERSFWETDYSYLHEAPRQSITWRRVPHIVWKHRDGRNIRCVRHKYSAMVASRVAIQLKPGSGSISDWV